MNSPNQEKTNSGPAVLPTSLTKELKDIAQGNTSSTEISDLQSEKSKISEVVFVHAEHTDKNAQEIVNALKDCDIIALEAVGGHPFNRGLRQRNMTRAVQPNSGVVFEKPPEELSLYNRLVFELQNSGKRFVYIDVSETDPEYELELAEQQEQEKTLGILLGNSMDEARRFEEGLIHLSAKTHQAREKLVRTQLQQILKKQDKPVKVGVVQGAAHSSTFQQMAKEDTDLAEVSRVIVPKSGRNFLFDPTTEAMRYAKHFPDREMPEQMLNRVVLSAYFNICIDTQDHPHQEVTKKLRSKTDEEVTQILDRIDRVLQSRLRRLPRLKYRKIKSIMEKEFQ